MQQQKIHLKNAGIYVEQALAELQLAMYDLHAGEMTVNQLLDNEEVLPVSIIGYIGLLRAARNDMYRILNQEK
jgi:hypothetical protein